jgi:hypothetical protein
MSKFKYCKLTDKKIARRESKSDKVRIKGTKTNQDYMLRMRDASTL